MEARLLEVLLLNMKQRIPAPDTEGVHQTQEMLELMQQEKRAWLALSSTCRDHFGLAREAFTLGRSVYPFPHWNDKSRQHLFDLDVACIRLRNRVQLEMMEERIPADGRNDAEEARMARIFQDLDDMMHAAGLEQT